MPTNDQVKELAAQIIDKWTAQLRDPNNKQTTNGNLLSEDGSRCCLGVLCDVIGLNRSMGQYGYIKTGPYEYEALFTAYIPHEVSCLVGLSPTGRLIGDVDFSLPNDVSMIAYVRDTLANMNDDSVPFPLIADIIEFNKQALIDGARWDGFIPEWYHDGSAS